MLKATWYLIDGNRFFADLPDAPHLDEAGQNIIGEVAALFSDESDLGRAKSVATVQVMLLAAEHLGDNLAATATRHDHTDVSRLVEGLNLVLAHLTQTIQRLAADVDARRFPGITTLPADTVQTITASLSIAGANGEICAAHLKETSLTLRAAAN